MPRILVIKTGAAGDVVRTTPILHLFKGDAVDWITAPENAALLAGTAARVLTDPAAIDRSASYDLVISLEEDAQTLDPIFAGLRFGQVVGAYATAQGAVRYTAELRDWFDMSLIGARGIAEANRLKWANRKSYQDIVFAALGTRFAGEEYILPAPRETSLHGEVALVASAGGRWPNKRWGHWEALADKLAARCTVNLLPWRSSLLEHLGDLANHSVIVAPDSLPLHFAIGLGKPTVGLFNCTSPWEIHTYGRMAPIISPCLRRYFYSTEFNAEATRCLPLDEVYAAVAAQLSGGLVRARHGKS